MRQTRPDDSIATDVVRHTLRRQLHASLTSLHDAVAACPDDLWLDPRPTNAFWQIAYHTLYFTHMYLCADEAAFRPWAQHVADVQNLGALGPGDDADPRPAHPAPYAKAQVLAYWAVVDGMVDGALDAMDLHRADSGFSWYPISKLEHQMANIRHVQHHAAQLADRLRAHGGAGTRWIKTVPARRTPS